MRAATLSPDAAPSVNRTQRAPARVDDRVGSQVASAGSIDALRALARRASAA
jgi:hypothetical protein